MHSSTSSIEPQVASRRHRPSSAISKEFMREIDGLSIPAVLPADRVLFREGDAPEHLYLLKEGEVVFTIQCAGKIVPCFSVKSGALLGLSAVIAGTPFALTATASPGAKVRQIEAHEFLARMDGHTDRYMCILRFLAEETLQAHQALAEMLVAS